MDGHVRITAAMATSREASIDMARVLGEEDAITDSTARCIAGWYASPNVGAHLAALSMGRRVLVSDALQDVTDLRPHITPDEALPLDLLTAWLQQQLQPITGD